MNFTYAIDNVTRFSHLSQFRDVKDFNNNIEMFLAEHKEYFTKSELIAFKRLVRLACKIPGVATASIRYILNVISDKGNGYGISESTFQRMRRKAVKFGILTIETTERTDGSQSSNLWIFNRVAGNSSSIDTPSKEEKGHEATSVKDSIIRRMKPHKTGINYKTNNNYILETAKATKNAIPSVIYDTLAPFFNAKELRRITGVIFRAKTKKVRLEQHRDAFMEVMLDCIRRYKQGIIQNLDDYMYVSIRKLSRMLYLY